MRADESKAKPTWNPNLIRADTGAPALKMMLNTFRMTRTWSVAVFHSAVERRAGPAVPAV